jgi:hypothetical protein
MDTNGRLLRDCIPEILEAGSAMPRRACSTRPSAYRHCPAKLQEERDELRTVPCRTAPRTRRCARGAQRNPRRARHAVDRHRICGCSEAGRTHRLRGRDPAAALQRSDAPPGTTPNQPAAGLYAGPASQNEPATHSANASTVESLEDDQPEAVGWGRQPMTRPKISSMQWLNAWEVLPGEATHFITGLPTTSIFLPTPWGFLS